MADKKKRLPHRYKAGEARIPDFKSRMTVLEYSSSSYILVKDLRYAVGLVAFRRRTDSTDLTYQLVVFARSHSPYHVTKD